MAIFTIDGEQVTEEQFLKSVEIIKFPKLSEHAKAILNEVDKHQKEFGRKDEEFPDSQKSKSCGDYLKFLSGDFELVPCNVPALTRIPLGKDTIYIEIKEKKTNDLKGGEESNALKTNKEHLEKIRNELLSDDKINTPWAIYSVLSCGDENELERILKQKTPVSFSYKPNYSLKNQFAEAGSKAGKKYNQNKPQMSRLFEQFPNALQMIVLASTYGANKYSEKSNWDNFLSVPGGSKSYLDATLRHFIAPEDQDEESKLPHIGHFAWNALAALEIFCREKEINMKEFSENYLKNL